MFNPTKKAKFTSPTKFNTEYGPRTIDSKITNITGRISKLHNEINKIDELLKSKLGEVISGLSTLNNTQCIIKMIYLV